VQSVHDLGHLFEDAQPAFGAQHRGIIRQVGGRIVQSMGVDHHGRMVAYCKSPCQGRLQGYSRYVLAHRLTRAQ
jgi:hypothetical protein